MRPHGFRRPISSHAPLPTALSSLVTLGVLLRLAEAARRARSTEEGGGDASSGSVRNPFPVGEDAPAARAEFPLSERQGERSSGAENRIRQPILPSLGGRLAIGDNNILFASTRYPFGGTGPDGGVKTAVLEQVTMISKIHPNPIVVSAGKEVFSNVDLTYRLLPPDENVTRAEVVIEVQGGTPIAQLPGSFDQTGQGTVRWPSGTIVDPSRTYLARATAEKDGQPVQALPKRLPFTVVPLAVTSRDRLMLIQFALPEQGEFAEAEYSVEVFLARKSDEFPTQASFNIWSQEIKNAYPNLEAIWQIPSGSAENFKQWFTRKIDKMEMPPGTDKSIRRQAFEISTVLAGYPKVRVVVRSDQTGLELGRIEGEIKVDGEWSELIETITNRIRASAGDFVPDVPILPAPDVFEPAKDFWGRLRGLAAAATIAARPDMVDSVYTPLLYTGMIEGFMAGLKGDAQAALWVKQAFTQDPRTTAKSLWEFIQEIRNSFPSWADLKNTVSRFYDRYRSLELGPTEFEAAGSAYYYYMGFFMGFVYEVVASLAVTAGVGGVVKATRLGAWMVQLTARAAAVIRVLGYCLQWLGRMSGATRVAREVLTFLLEQAGKVAELVAKYPRIEAVCNALTKTLTVSKSAAVTALHWLTVIDRMGDEAGVRFVAWVEGRTAPVAERWLTRWATLRNGKRAIKEAFEATEKAGEVADGAYDALVLAGDAEHPIAGKTYAGEFTTKYSDRVESVLQRLRQSAEDLRYSDETVAETVRVLSASELRAISDDAVEGAANFVSQAGSDLAVEARQALLRRMVALPEADGEALLIYMKNTAEPQAAMGVRNLLEATAPCVF